MELLFLSTLFIPAFSALSSSDVSINTTECFVSVCNGVFSITPSINVSIGGYVNVLNSVRTADSAASLSGVMWLSWPVCSTYTTPQGLAVYRPSITVVFYNIYTSDNYYLTPVFSEPVCNVRSGFAYQRFDFVGNFKQYYNFRSFPLDNHVISVDFVDSALNGFHLTYIPEDVNASDLLGLSATGWTVTARAQLVDNVLIPSQAAPTSLVPFSRFRLQVYISRGALVFGFRMLPPIIITVFCSLLILTMSLRDLVTRIATSIGGLVTIVFIQFSFSWAVPTNLSYLVGSFFLFVFLNQTTFTKDSA